MSKKTLLSDKRSSVYLPACDSITQKLQTQFQLKCLLTSSFHPGVTLAHFHFYIFHHYKVERVLYRGHLITVYQRHCRRSVLLTFFFHPFVFLYTYAIFRYENTVPDYMNITKHWFTIKPSCTKTDFSQTTKQTGLFY